MLDEVLCFITALWKVSWSFLSLRYCSLKELEYNVYYRRWRLFSALDFTFRKVFDVEGGLWSAVVLWFLSAYWTAFRSCLILISDCIIAVEIKLGMFPHARYFVLWYCQISQSKYNSVPTSQGKNEGTRVQIMSSLINTICCSET